MLDAVLERITYANEETGYTIARVATDRSGADLLTVVGALLGVQPGESLRLVGRWGSHPKYGRQFEVDSFTTVLPATIQGIERYLGSGLIKGIGPRTAGRIVGHFGVDTLRVIEEQPGRLVEVAGLGPKRTAMIGRAWEEQKAIKEVMVFLQGVGVSTSLAVRIYKNYGDGSISVVRDEPYRLAAEVWGIGFKTADAIAQAVGIPHDSPQRVQAGIQYTLSEAADCGHCYLPEPNLLTDAAQILGVPADLVGACLDDLAAAVGVIREPVPGIGGGTIPAVYLVPFHRAETSLAAALLRLATTPADRMPGIRVGRLGQGAGVAAGPDRRRAGRRAGAGGAAGVDLEGGGADRGARLREVVHRQIGDHPGGGEAGEDRAGGADRAGGETADRAVRAPGRDRAPVAATAPGRGPRATPHRAAPGQSGQPDPARRTPRTLVNNVWRGYSRGLGPQGSAEHVVRDR